VPISGPAYYALRIFLSYTILGFNSFWQKGFC
jgi:hypothetical protein